MKDIGMTFAENLKRRRKALGMTQRDLAEKLLYSEKAISKWERGNGMPPISLLPALAEALEVRIDELFFCVGEIKYYLGIDGGGTKTEFLLVDGSGREIKRATLGASNPNDVGMSATKEIFRQGILEVIGDCHPGCISLFAGFAGGGSRDNADVIKEYLESFGFAEVSCGSDAWNAASVGLLDSDGIIVIMGTGSIAYAKKGGELLRVGGYGYLFGDGGSGFAFGRDVILAALRDEDGSGEPTCLRQTVSEQLGSDNILERLTDFYKGGKRYVARYARLAFEAYDKGDAVADGIVRRNIEDIALIIRGAARHFDEKTVKVVICGGLTEREDIILPLLSEMLDSEDKKYVTEVCRRPQVQGAVYMAGLKQ